ncbi:hypothetical protein EDB85DRAFT_1887442 [Lactarius pseudohatsudake]|nr:hypothetical protein EDB85DRAFT_1887442 [Lactarius pseudohatsudake]
MALSQPTVQGRVVVSRLTLNRFPVRPPQPCASTYLNKTTQSGSTRTTNCNANYICRPDGCPSDALTWPVTFHSSVSVDYPNRDLKWWHMSQNVDEVYLASVLFQMCGGHIALMSRTQRLSCNNRDGVSINSGISQPGPSSLRWTSTAAGGKYKDLAAMHSHCHKTAWYNHSHPLHRDSVAARTTTAPAIATLSNVVTSPTVPSFDITTKATP